MRTLISVHRRGNAGDCPCCRGEREREEGRRGRDSQRMREEGENREERRGREERREEGSREGSESEAEGGRRGEERRRNKAEGRKRMGREEGKEDKADSHAGGGAAAFDPQRDRLYPPLHPHEPHGSICWFLQVLPVPPRSLLACSYILLKPSSFYTITSSPPPLFSFTPPHSPSAGSTWLSIAWAFSLISPPPPLPRKFPASGKKERGWRRFGYPRRGGSASPSSLLPCSSPPAATS